MLLKQFVKKKKLKNDISRVGGGEWGGVGGLTQSAAPRPTPASINNRDFSLRRADVFLFFSLFS